MTLSFRNYLSGDEKIRLTSSIIILSENNKLLLELRSDCNLWGLIGGVVKVGEDPKCTACRECEEETGLVLSKNNLSLLDIYGDIKEYRILDFKDNLFHSIDIVYYVLFSNIDNLKISHESLDLQFFDIKLLNYSNIVKPAIPPIKDFLNLIF